jgi:hypothetical protein
MRPKLGSRLLRQVALPSDPFRDPGRPGVISGGRQPYVSKSIGQFYEEFSGLWNSRLGVEGIGQPAFSCGAWHELRDALRTGGARGVQAKSTFLPN